MSNTFKTILLGCTILAANSFANNQRVSPDTKPSGMAKRDKEVVKDSDQTKTVKEQATKSSKDLKRGVKKGYHRTKEWLCMKDDLECEAQKAKHRAIETKDAAKDKVSETIDKID